METLLDVLRLLGLLIWLIGPRDGDRLLAPGMLGQTSGTASCSGAPVGTALLENGCINLLLRQRLRLVSWCWCRCC